ncbi:MAG: response regulator transcription factor [Myxococcales bacterium]|nr:response regulator transcription factor [Myxococcales bacterium]
MTAKRILIVDDSALIRASAAHALEGVGFDVTVRAAFDELLEHGIDGFDLILMDVHMPELYGDDVAFTLRGERGVTTPIYLFSSLEERELAKLAADAGIDGYILKSNGLDELVTRVRQILAPA